MTQNSKIQFFQVHYHTVFLERSKKGCVTILPVFETKRLPVAERRLFPYFFHFFQKIVSKNVIFNNKLNFEFFHCATLKSSCVIVYDLCVDLKYSSFNHYNSNGSQFGEAISNVQRWYIDDRRQMTPSIVTFSRLFVTSSYFIIPFSLKLFFPSTIFLDVFYWHAISPIFS